MGVIGVTGQPSSVSENERTYDVDDEQVGEDMEENDDEHDGNDDLDGLIKTSLLTLEALPESVLLTREIRTADDIELSLTISTFQ